jgi:Fe-S-cluster containining protein
MMKTTINETLKLARAALKQTDDSIQKFVSLESLPEPLDCRPGCHFCCYNLPMVTPPEALLIGHHIEQTFTDQQKQTLNVKIKKILKKIVGKHPDEIFMMRHKLPCIFLEDSVCLIYTVRPVLCRTCSSTSVDHCKTIFETRNHRARLRTYPQMYKILQTIHSHLTAFCREKGCQSDISRLSEAVEDYLNHPNPIDSWFQGETIFNLPK